MAPPVNSKDRAQETEMNSRDRDEETAMNSQDRVDEMMNYQTTQKRVLEDKMREYFSCHRSVMTILPKEAVCQVCGMSGFPSSLIYCSMCKISTQHGYCLGIGLGLHRSEIWICEECETKPLEVAAFKSQFKNKNSGPNKESKGKPSSSKVVETLKKSDAKGKEAMKEIGRASMDNLVDESGNNLHQQKLSASNQNAEQFIDEQMSEDMEISEDEPIVLDHLADSAKDKHKSVLETNDSMISNQMQRKGKKIAVDKLTYSMSSKGIGTSGANYIDLEATYDEPIDLDLSAEDTNDRLKSVLEPNDSVISNQTQRKGKGISGANYIDLDPSDDEKAAKYHSNYNNKKPGSGRKDDNISIRLMGKEISVGSHACLNKQCAMPYSKDGNTRQVDENTPTRGLNSLFAKKVQVKKRTGEKDDKDMQPAENMNSLIKEKEVVQQPNEYSSPIPQQPLRSVRENSEVVTPPRCLNLFPLRMENLSGKKSSGPRNDLNLELTLRCPSPCHANTVSSARFSFSDANTDEKGNI